MDALRKLFDVAVRILALENARTLTRSRMMGAQVFSDNAALELQRNGYLRIEQEMREAASRLDQILLDVQPEVEANVQLKPQAIAAELDRFARSGFSREIYDGVLKAGLPPALARAFAALPMDNTLTELVKANGLFLIPFVGSLKRFVRAVQDEREAVIAGEDVCAPPPGKGEDEYDFPEAGDEPRPRPRRRCCC